MIYILILLFIPIFFVGVITYSSTLFEYMINNNLDTVLLLIGVFVTIISLFVLFKSIMFIDKEDYTIIRLQNRVDAIIGILSFTLLLLFGVSLLVNSFINTMSYSKVLIAVAIIIIYVYVLYYYLFSKKQYPCKVVEIAKMNDKLYCVTLEHKDLGLKEVYYKTKPNLTKNKVYNCSYSNGLKLITKISNQIVEVK